MSYPSSFDALSKPTPTTVRNSSTGISPANTVSAIIQSQEYIEHHLGLAPAGVSFTADAGTNVLTASAHGLADNDVVSVSSTGTLPGGLAADTYYYVVTSTTNTFQLATTRGGSAIDLTSAGSGTHSFTSLFSEGKFLQSSSSGTRSQWSSALSLVSGSLILPQSASAAPTVEGSIAWDTDDDLLKVGTGAATKTMMDTNSTQTATNKTFTAPTITNPTITGGGSWAGSPTLTTPTIGDFSNATHTHANNAGGGTLNGANAIQDGTITPAELMSGTGASWAWQSHTPVVTASVTNPTLGTDNVAQGYYVQIGKVVIYKFAIQFGTASVNAGSGSYFVSLPVAARLVPTDYQTIPIGTGRLSDSSTSNSGPIFPEIETSTTLQLVYYASAGAAGTAAPVANNAPWTWAASDKITGYVVYEAA